MLRVLSGLRAARLFHCALWRKIALGGLLSGTLFFATTPSWAAQVTVAWDATGQAGVTGYKVYAGLASRSYTTTLDVGNKTTATLTGLEEGRVYYLAVKAYGSGQESPYSAELLYNASALDTDKDGLSDIEEQTRYRTNPSRADTDGDGLGDGQEVSMWGNNWSKDIDGDGLVNLLDRDADGDGATDGQEISGGSNPGDANSTPTAEITEIPQTEWQLVYVDSQEVARDDARAINAFDGDVTTNWRTQWYPTDPPPPHEIQIDLGEEYDVRGFRYLPRQDGSTKGQIKGYEFYVSRDRGNWSSPVAKGVFANDVKEKEIQFPARIGRYIRLRALSEVNGGPWTSVAELNVLAVW